MSHVDAPNSQKRCTENEDREWVLLLEGLALLPLRMSLWTRTQSCSCIRDAAGAGLPSELVLTGPS